MPIIYGLPIVIEAESQPETITVNNTKFPIHQLTSINLFPDTAHNGEKLLDRIKVNFDTLVIFEGDEIGITASATGVNNKYVSRIFVLITDPSFDIADMSIEELQQSTERLITSKHVLILYPDSFVNRLSVPFFKPSQQIMIHAVIEVNGTLAYRAYSDLIVTTVNPKIEKVNTETNEAILKLVEKTEISNYEQQRTNNILIGIGYLGIGVVIVIGAIDILARAHQAKIKHPKEKSWKEYYRIYR